MRILFIPFYIFYKLLPLIVISLCVYESCYYPDLDRIQFDKYKDEAILLSRAGVPASILIYRETTSKAGVDYLLHKYPGFKNADETHWIKAVGLNKKQATQILTFKSWLRQSD